MCVDICSAYLAFVNRDYKAGQHNKRCKGCSAINTFSLFLSIIPIGVHEVMHDLFHAKTLVQCMLYILCYI